MFVCLFVCADTLDQADLIIFFLSLESLFPFLPLECSNNALLWFFQVLCSYIDGIHIYIMDMLYSIQRIWQCGFHEIAFYGLTTTLCGPIYRECFQHFITSIFSY
jgi:hypothetical protein